MRHWLTLKFQN